jgi:hypothetical protein
MIRGENRVHRDKGEESRAYAIFSCRIFCISPRTALFLYSSWSVGRNRAHFFDFYLSWIEWFSKFWDKVFFGSIRLSTFDRFLAI